MVLSEHANQIAPEETLLDYLEGPNTVHLLDEKIWINADIEAFFPHEEVEDKDPNHHLVLELKRDLGGDPGRCADAFRRWTEQLFLWHEAGHVYADEKLVQLRERIGEERYWIFLYPGSELLANVQVLKRLEKGSDELRQRFWISLLCRGWLRSLDFGQVGFYENHAGDIFVLRAMMEECPSAHLEEFLERMEQQAAVAGPHKSGIVDRRRVFEQWLGAQAMQAQEEVLATFNRNDWQVSSEIRNMQP